MRKLNVEISIHSPDGPAPSAMERLREVYAVAQAMHAEIYQACKAVLQRASALSIEESVDCQLCLREAAKFADDTRKECNKLLELLEKLTCMNWALDPNADEKIVGELANGSPVVKTRVILPTLERDPERYAKLMDWLGVPEDLRDRGKVLYHEGQFTTEVVKINWNGFQDAIDQWLLQGHVLPDFVLSKENSFTDQKVILRKTHDIL